MGVGGMLQIEGVKISVDGTTFSTVFFWQEAGGRNGMYSKERRERRPENGESR
jgi:hypothetical protein